MRGSSASMSLCVHSAHHRLRKRPNNPGQCLVEWREFRRQTEPGRCLKQGAAPGMPVEVATLGIECKPPEELAYEFAVRAFPELERIGKVPLLWANWTMPSAKVIVDVDIDPNPA